MMLNNLSDLHHIYSYTNENGFTPSCYIDIHAKEIEKFRKEMNHVAFTGFLSSALSIFGTVSIIAFCCWKRACCKEQVKPLLHLSVADLILAVLWISGSTAYFANLDMGKQTLDMAKKCFIWQLVTELIHLVTFFLTVNYSVNVYMEMKDRTIRIYQFAMSGNAFVDTSSSRRWIRRTLYIVSWILPILLLLPIIVNVKDKYICPCQRCVILLDVPRLEGSLSPSIKTYGYSVFAVVLALSIASILVLYVLTLRLYWPAAQGFHTDRERRQLANMQCRITLYIFSFLICWSPAFIISLLKWSENSRAEEKMTADLDQYFPLFILQALLAPLQGFLNSIVYGWSRKTFRNLSRESTEHDEQSATPYFSYSPLPSSVNEIEDSGDFHQESRLHQNTPLPM